MAVLSEWEAAARLFEPPVRRWPSPMAMAMALDPGTRTTSALDLVDRALVDLADGVTDRLAVFLPPQEGKSQAISRRFPTWLLSQNPGLRVAIVSYDDTRAVRWGRDIRRDIRNHPALSVTLLPDSTAVGRFETTAGGMVLCVGVNSGLTGEPVDVVVIDDPVKGRAEAESPVMRDRTWDVWENTILPRLGPGARVALMQTRWHTDDLGGRILDAERHLWRVLSIPAIAEDDDPLGRRPGEEMLSVRGREPGYFHSLSERMSPYVFRSLYQQRPTSAQGGLFPRGAWRYWHPRVAEQVTMGDGHADLRDCWRFLTVDLAASTRTSADWTVCSAWAVTGDGSLVLLDRVRGRTAEADHWALARPLAERWKIREVGVESTMMGTTLVRAASVAGLLPFDLKADTDKVTRAIPYSALVKQGRVWLPASAKWLDEWLDEHADFPNAAHDDQVDTGSYAARRVVGDWWPGPNEPPPRDDPREAALAWDGAGEVDLASAPF